MKEADVSKNEPQIRADEFEALEMGFYAQPKILITRSAD